jgi:hypothetical protein
MAQPIVYIDVSAIRNGKLEEVTAAMKGLASFVEANVPQLISYGFFLNDDRTRMTVVGVHRDSASLQFHLDVGAGEFRKFGGLIDLLKIDVYGRVTEAVLRRLHQKARALGTGTVAVHEFYAGFSR